MSSKQPNQRRGELNEGQEVARQLLKPHRDPAKALDPLKELLDLEPLAVQVLIKLPQRGVRGIGENDHRAFAPFKLLNERLGVVGAVGHDIRVERPTLYQSASSTSTRTVAVRP